jgi:hypothetical protein
MGVVGVIVGVATFVWLTGIWAIVLGLRLSQPGRRVSPRVIRR